MAKGNLGNLLQHEVELRLVEALLRGRPRRLHVVVTHSMPPMSPIEVRPPSPDREAFRRVHEMVLGSERLPASPYLRAWRRVAREERDVAMTHYPNTFRLLAAAGVAVEGHACDVDVDAQAQLGRLAREHAWALQIHGDWRAAMPAAFAPLRPGVPWLVTHDPYRYEPIASTGGFMGEDDLARLIPLYREMFRQQPRGAIALCSYAMSPSQVDGFREAAKSLSDRVRQEEGFEDMSFRVVEMSRHAAALIEPASERRGSDFGNWIEQFSETPIRPNVDISDPSGSPTLPVKPEGTRLQVHGRVVHPHQRKESDGGCDRFDSGAPGSSVRVRGLSRRALAQASSVGSPSVRSVHCNQVQKRSMQDASL